MPILEQTEEQRKAAYAAAKVPLPAPMAAPVPTLPKVGDPIPGTDLKYEPADIANLSTNISIGDLTGGEAPFTIEGGKIIPTPDIKSIPLAEISKDETSKTDFTKELEDLLLKQTGEEKTRAAAFTEATATSRRELNELNKRIQLHQAEALKSEQEALERGETLGFATGEAARVQKQNTFEALRLSALAQAKIGEVTLAAELAGKAIDLEFQDIEKNILVAKRNIMSNYDKLTKDEKTRADAALLALNSQDEFVKSKKEERKKIEDWAVKAAASGKATNADLEKIRNAGSEAESASLAAPFLEEKLTGAAAEFKQFFPKIDISTSVGRQTFLNWKAQIAAAERKPEEPLTIATQNVLKGEYGSIVKSASNLVGAERGKTSKAAIAEAIAGGDFVSAYAQIANNVEESLTGETKTRLSSARTDYAVMLGLREALNEYAEGGGNMGLLQGKEEEVKRKLGIDSGKASALAVTLWREFQTYRLNMTGAAFSPAESKDYAAVNPTLGKSLNLNLSVIDGALNQLENRITSTVNTRVPGSQKIYDNATGGGQTEIDLESASIGSVIEIGGVKYKKVGEDQFEQL